MLEPTMLTDKKNQKSNDMDVVMSVDVVKNNDNTKEMKNETKPATKTFKAKLNKGKNSDKT